MSNIEWTCPIPKFVPMRQPFNSVPIRDPRKAAFSAIVKSLNNTNKISRGAKVALAVGSRGIGHIDEIVAGVVDAIRQLGAHPIIVPAMGSHGGDDPRGKSRILENLRVTQATVGAAVSNKGESVPVGYAQVNLPVYCHAEAFSSDAIILINRIKQHTDFRGKIESGLIKMAGIGLGGSLGAAAIHAKGYGQLAERVRLAGEAAIKLLPIQLGLAIIEAPNGSPAHLEAIQGPDILSREEILLAKSRKLVPKLPVNHLDVLVVAEMGKDISGTGLDPAIIGRYPSGKKFPEEDMPNYYRVAVLDLTEASAGNSSGIGLCDVTTRRVFDKTDFKVMYKNVITGKGSLSARFPMVMKSDREAICVALLTCLNNPAEADMAIIRNTLQLEYFLVSETIVPVCLTEGAKIAGAKSSLQFDSAGSLILPEPLTDGVK